MKYTSEQLKDLLHLSQHGCRKRACGDCIWHVEKCQLKTSWGNEIFCKLPMIKNVINTEMTSARAKKIAKELIREML